MVTLGFEVGFASESTSSLDSHPNLDANIAVLSFTRDLAQFHDLLMHPFLTAVVMECSPCRIAREGLKCSHAEYVILSESLLHDADLDDTNSDITATLETLKLLLSKQGILIIHGSPSAHRSRIDHFFATIATRVHYVADENQVVALIRTHLQP